VVQIISTYTNMLENWAVTDAKLEHIS